EKLLQSNPTNAFIHLANGSLHFKARDLGVAKSELSKAVSLAPNEPRFHLALATLHAVLNETNSADAEFKTAADLAPAKSPEVIRWAEYKLRIGQVDAAKKILTERLEKVPDYTPALSTLVDITMGEKNYDEASGYIQKILAIEPNNFNGLLNRSKLSMIKNQPAKALEDLTLLARPGWFENVPLVHYQTAVAQLGLKDRAKALAALDRAIVLNTNYVDAVLLKSQLQIENLDFATAIPVLVQASAAHPNDPRLSSLLATAYRGRKSPDQALAVYASMAARFKEDPLPFYYSGLIYKEQGKFDQARASFDKAIERSPNAAMVIDELVELDLIAKKPADALKRIEPYMKEFPKSPVPHYLQGRVFAAQNKVPEAIAELKKAVEIEPKYLIAHQLLAQIYTATSQPADALKHYEKITEINPNDLASLFMVGTLSETSGDIKKAEATYEKIIAANPNFAAALNNLAGIMSEHGGDLNRAADLARKCRDLSGLGPEVRASASDTLGWILYKQGDYSRAQPLFEEALNVLKNNPEIQYHLGMAYYMSGNEPQARKALEASLQSTNEFKGRSDVKNTLSILALDPKSTGSEAVQRLTKRISDAPNDAIAHLKLARIYSSQNENEKAASEYQSAIKLSPKSALPVAEAAEFTMDHLKDREKALELAKQARSLTSDPKLFAQIGRVAFLAGDPTWSLPLLQEALTMDPANARLSYYTGLAAFGAGQVNLAHDKLTAASNSKTAFPESSLVKPTLQLVDAYLQPGASNASAEGIKALSQADPNSPLVLFASGLQLETQNNFKAAAESYEQVLRFSPGFVPALKQLAVIYSDQLPNDIRAQEVASKARSATPADPALLKALGKVAYRKGEFKEAARLLRDSLNRLDKEDSDLLYYLGMAQYKLNDKQARSSLNRALSLDRKSLMAPEAEKAIAELK
ncbi:MAG: tetratricopeptide repeat protein, partial [Verrucomicrobiota bacterium]